MSSSFSARKDLVFGNVMLKCNLKSHTVDKLDVVFETGS